MKTNFLKQPQNPIKIDVLYSSKINGGKNSMKSNFENLIENYAALKYDAEELGRDKLFELILAFLEDRFSRYSWSKHEIRGNLEIPITIGMLRKLNSNLYNTQRVLLDELKDAVIEDQFSNVSEKLDEEKERIDQMPDDDDYHRYKDDILLNVLDTKKHKEVLGNATRR